MDSLILQTAIGLIFIFAIVAGLVSTLTELITRFIGLRSEYLLRGLRTMVDGSGDFTLPWREIVSGWFVEKRKSRLADGRLADGADAASAAGTANAAASSSASAAGSATGTATAASTSAPEPPFVTRLMTHPLISVSASQGFMPENPGNAPLTNKQRRQLPPYVSGRSFARALFDMVVPNSSGKTTLSDIQDSIRKLPSGVLPDPLRKALLALATESQDDVSSFLTNVEKWYDDQMARVSGWYKRHVGWVSLALGVVIVLAANLNVISIARSLYTDQALQGSVVTQASHATSCTADPVTCLKQLRAEIGSVRGAGLPIGWTEVQSCAATGARCNWFEQRGLWEAPGRSGVLQIGYFGLLLLGWALMVIALLPGARFWFDALGQLGSLRSTGPKPATT